MIHWKSDKDSAAPGPRAIFRTCNRGEMLGSEGALLRRSATIVAGVMALS